MQGVAEISHISRGDLCDGSRLPKVPHASTEFRIVTADPTPELLITMQHLLVRDSELGPGIHLTLAIPHASIVACVRMSSRERRGAGRVVH
jgi:hypothetical protein